MDLQERLRKAGIDCFRTVHFYDNRMRDAEEAYYFKGDAGNDTDIVNPFLASQYGLICEYYMKGTLLPTLKLTNPENNPKLKQIIDELSDEEKYRILIGDNDLEKQLSQKYKVSLKDIKKISGESIKNMGHSLSGLAEAILRKARNNEFEPQRKNEILVEVFGADHFKSALSEQNVSEAFVKGRYGHLDSTSIDISALRHVVCALRWITYYFMPGIDITVWECDKKSNAALTLDDRRFFHNNIKKIYIMNDRKIERVYLYSDAGVVPEYGVETEVDEEISFWGTAHSYQEDLLYSSATECDGNSKRTIETDERNFQTGNPEEPYQILFDLSHEKQPHEGYNVKKHFSVKKGRTIYIVLEDGKNFWVETSLGKLAVVPEPEEVIYKEKVEEYEQALVNGGCTNGQFIKLRVGKNITGKLINSGTPLSKRFAQCVHGREDLRRLHKNFGRCVRNPNANYVRPRASEFREVYMQCTKGILLYRLAKGREIFQEIMGEILNGKSLTDAKDYERGEKE